jgi:hypothetical protein
MNPGQRTELERIREELYTVLVKEADPHKLPPMDTRENRGDRAWYKKNAIATASLIMRLEDLLGLRGAGAYARPPRDPEEKEGDPPDPGASTASADDAERLIREAGAKVARIGQGAPTRGKKG